MFGDFESIDWAKYDVTLERKDLETLARLKSSTAQVKRALRHIETAIYDQGCAGPVTTKAVPLLVEVLAANPSPAAKAGVLSLLCDVLTDDEDFVFEPFALRGALVAAIRRGAPRYVKLLGDASPDVRAQAARILAYHPGTGTLLARRVADEKDRRVQGTLLIAAAMQKQRPKLAAKDAVVRTCVALATLVAGGELTGALVDTLFAAVDDTKQDGGCALFHGNLRAAAIDALGRFGRGNAQVTDGLLARRGKEQRIGAIPAKRAIGQLAVEALAALAVTKRGTTRCSLGD